jgi:integrase
MPTLADLCTQYQREYLIHKSPALQAWWRYFCTKLLRDLGDRPLQDLSPEDIRAWKLALAHRYKPGTVHAYLKRLSRLLRVAVDEYGWLETHPMARISKPSPGRGRVRFLTTAERLRLLTACAASPNTMLYPVVVVALGTGGRKEEVRGLQWRHVDLQAGVVRFTETKTELSRSVPLLGDALRVVQALQGTCAPGVPWVFPAGDHQGPRLVESAWGTARKKAGLADFPFHGLRHTYASYLAMSGASLRDIAALLGHASIQQTMVYTHLLENHTRGVVENMAQRFLQ